MVIIPGSWGAEYVEMKQRWLLGEASESWKFWAVPEGFTTIQSPPDLLVLSEARWEALSSDNGNKQGAATWSREPSGNTL